nr:hypothetical protein [uncultured Cohaesibacter sp.]
MPTVKAKPKRLTPSEARYRETLKELRGGVLDERLFRLRGNDASYEAIAKRLRVYPRDILARANRVYEQFEVPKDGVGQNGTRQESHYA